MKYKFNPFERAVGIFITFTLFGTLAIGLGIAVKKSWFEEMISFSAYVDSASNIRVGSGVYMSGLKVGKIEEVELDRDQIKVTFNVLKRYGPSITAGSKVKFVRSFLIGERKLVINQGPVGVSRIMGGSVLPTDETLDIVDLMSGDKLLEIVARLDSVLKNLDDTLVIGKDLALQLNDKKVLKQTLDNLAFASTEVRKALPTFIKKAPDMTKNMESIMQNLLVITSGLKGLEPVMHQIAVNFPEGSKKTIELLDESIVVLQAMQKSILLRGSVEDVRAERADKKQGGPKRLPASED